MLPFPPFLNLTPFVSVLAKQSEPYPPVQSHKKSLITRVLVRYRQNTKESSIGSIKDVCMFPDIRELLGPGLFLVPL